MSQRALVDLVETATPEASGAFVTLATRLAEEVGGRKVVANEVHLPTIVADERSSKADQAARLLVITRYPSERASELALAKRKEWGPELLTDAIRTYAVNPVRGIEAVLPRILTTTLGLRGKETVPKCDETARLEPLIEASHILGHEPAGGIYEGRWKELIERTGDRPLWMLNFLEFAKTADYREDAEHVAPESPISGAAAYERYGRGMVSSLAAVGGRIGFASRGVESMPGTEDGRWHQIVIAVYPSTAAMMKMLSLPGYQAAHLHRAAALVRTRLLATQPI